MELDKVLCKDGEKIALEWAAHAFTGTRKEDEYWYDFRRHVDNCNTCSDFMDEGRELKEEE